nr:hypothetical protein [Pseudohalocynthiibacter aestuariivivens]
MPDSVGASILALTGSGDEAGVYESLDNMVARITAYGDTIGDRAGWVFGAVLGAIFFVLLPSLPPSPPGLSPSPASSSR